MPGSESRLNETIIVNDAVNVNDAVIVVMAKQPQAGKTKTRLCPPLNPAQAAALYEALLLDTFTLAGRLPGVDLGVAITPTGSRPYFEAVAPANALLLAVEGRDIGECLTKTLAQLLGLGYRKALALNSDGPSLPPEYLIQAIRCLDERDLVLGPSEDGGYYLIGLKTPTPALFRDIAWSTQQVLAQTLERAVEIGLSVAQTPAWYDIDTPADLARLQTELGLLPPDRLAQTRRFLADFEPLAGLSY
jgi:rSAM/selenodomain-associated transferase 1